MGAFGGSITVSKFWVHGELPESHTEKFMRQLKLRAFQPLTSDDDDEEHMGWTVCGSPLDLELEHDNVFLGSYVALGLRVDRWRFPTTLLKSQLEDAQRELLEKHGRERLSKVEKDDVRTRVLGRLKKKLIPTLRSFDFVWNLDRGQAWFWCQSTKTLEQLCALFEQTFGLELALDSPYLAAVERGLSEVDVERLGILEPTPFHAKTLEGGRARRQDNGPR